MKKVMTFFMVLLLGVSMLTAEEFTTGGVFVNAASTNLSYNLIGKTTNMVGQIVVGKTYRLESDIMEIKTKAGESVSMVFSTGLQSRVSPESTFSVDSFNQLVVNDVGQPQVLKAEYAVTALTLMDGELEVICPQVDTNSQCVIQTPLVNVNLAEGRLVIKSNPKYVLLNAIEGSVTVVDSKNKKSVIDKGQMGLIIPYPGRNNEIMVTTKAISPGELEKLTKGLNEMALAKKDVMFAVIDTKIVGIRLK
jgi:hypothetical protein